MSIIVDMMRQKNRIPAIFNLSYFAALTIVDRSITMLHMTQENLQTYKTQLEKEQRLILEEIKKNETPVDFGSDIDHFDEETDEAEEVGNQLAISGDLKKRLEDVRVALEKIREGKFGICEKCGKNIEKEILDIDPESRLCKESKLEAEEQ
jgi:RNA polymerase-binding transcription factor DksA